MNRLIVAIGLTCALFASSLAADSITYLDKKSGDKKRETQNADGCTVTSWSATTVKYKDKAGKDVSIARRDVVSIDRAWGSMGPDLMEAIETAKSSVKDAVPLFDAAISSGKPLDAEEAMYLKAVAWEQSASTNSGDKANAVSAYKAYTQKFKGGYFAESAWEVLSKLQSKASARRSTLKSMASASPALKYKGNLLLGQLESQTGNWSASISAFKSAQSAGKAFKGSKLHATAWLGYATFKGGNANSAKPILESVVSDKKFEAGETSEHELALSIAYPALGDVYLASKEIKSKDYENAYDAYMQGAFYCWWTRKKNEEGRSLGQAWYCTIQLKKELNSKTEKWKKLHEALKVTLNNGFPSQVTRIENKK